MKYTIALVIWVVLMSYGLLKPGDPNDPSYFLFPEDDKLIHLGLFAGATFLWIQSMKVEWKVVHQRAMSIAFFGGIILAASTETFQFWVPFRTPDFFDFFSNALGVVVSTTVHYFMEKKQRTPKYH